MQHPFKMLSWLPRLNLFCEISLCVTERDTSGLFSVLGRVWPSLSRAKRQGTGLCDKDERSKTGSPISKKWPSADSASLFQTMFFRASLNWFSIEENLWNGNYTERNLFGEVPKSGDSKSSHSTQKPQFAKRNGHSLRTNKESDQIKFSIVLNKFFHSF